MEPGERAVLTVKPSVLSIFLHQCLAVTSAASGFLHIKQTKSLISTQHYITFTVTNPSLEMHPPELKLEVHIKLLTFTFFSSGGEVLIFP